jgi:hypothetical protein
MKKTFTAGFETYCGAGAQDEPAVGPAEVVHPQSNDDAQAGQDSGEPVGGLGGNEPNDRDSVPELL